MSLGPRPTRAVAASVAVLALLLVGPLGGARGVASPRQPASPGLTLVDQTPGVDPGGTFRVSVRPTGIPAGATIRATVHDRVRSRSELATSDTGLDLRRAVHTATALLSELPADQDGTRHLSIVLTPTSPAAKAISVPGVYPVEVAALGAGGEPISSFVTDLILRPPVSAGAPPLEVAVLAQIDARPRTAAHPDVDAATVAGATDLIAALAAAPDVVATLAVRPETLESVAASTSAAATALLTALKAAAGARPLLALPYVATSPDGLAAAGIADELPHVANHGAEVLRRVLGASPSQTTWLAGPDLGGAGLSLLSALGVHQALVDRAHVEDVSDGVLSPVRPFLLGAPRSTGRKATTTTVAVPAGGSAETNVSALLTDSRLDARLKDDAPPALLANRVLAELATLWFEQPGTRRAVVLPVSTAVDGDAVRQILQGLRAPAMFRPVTVDAAFADAAPLLDRAGKPVRRSLRPAEPMAVAASQATETKAVRSLRDSVVTMVGPSSPLLDTIDEHLLRSVATALAPAERKAALAEARNTIQGLADAIQTPARATITLTARNGTVPLTIRNDTGEPVQAQVHLRSPKLELPGGSIIPVTLTGPSTRLDIAVRTRASGAFPFEVDITSPDGRLTVASTRYSVRSTAVSGVGLFLSAGAGLFLIVWWARHWRKARRSAKLVTSSHPTVAGPRPRTED